MLFSKICAPRALAKPLLSALTLAWFGTVSVSAQDIPAGNRMPQAPPANPPVESRSGQAGNPGPHPLGALTLYSIGQPTDEEQLYLEYVNRSRANPSAEGVRLATTTDPDVLAAYNFFGVDLSLMQAQFNQINSNAAPVAMNAKLTTAARLHSLDMFTKQYQGHFETNGVTTNTPGDRITAQGYNWSTYAENVYAYASGVWQGHAGFNVDWGGDASTGGMQSPAGHRNNIHNANMREVGVGIVNGVNGSVGPQIVTEDFSTQQGSTPFVTGVVYYDFNSNGFYDLGEGIGGVNVNVSGANYYAVTADSGGYAVPVSANGSYNVTFTANALTTTQRVATVSSLRNVKIDYLPIYTPPTISGPLNPTAGVSNNYTFSAVGAATSYDWQRTALSTYTNIEGAENGTANVTVVASPGYSVVASDVKATGTASFHLAHATPMNQMITLNPSLLLRTNSQLTFAKRLATATSIQTASAQISVDGGTNWTSLWSQSGTGGSGEGSFSRITNSLAAYAGKIAKFRFVYALGVGSYYSQTSSGVGFYVDDIAINNSDAVGASVTTSISNAITAFSFTPTNSGDFILMARAHINSRTLSWGPAFRVTASTPPPVLTLTSQPVMVGNNVQIDFSVANYVSGMTFQLWKTTDPGVAMTLDATASLTTLTPGSSFRFTTATGGAAKAFYRVKAAY